MNTENVKKIYLDSSLMIFFTSFLFCAFFDAKRQAEDFKITSTIFKLFCRKVSPEVLKSTMRSDFSII